jgi:hypothetical protein
MRKALSLKDLRKDAPSFEELARQSQGRFHGRSFKSLSDQEKWEVVELLAIQMGIVSSGEP